ncbi:hypothetical protein MAR_036442, partial [Mya arenaria]
TVKCTSSDNQYRNEHEIKWIRGETTVEFCGVAVFRENILHRHCHDNEKKFKDKNAAGFAAKGKSVPLSRGQALLQKANHAQESSPLSNSQRLVQNAVSLGIKTQTVANGTDSPFETGVTLTKKNDNQQAKKKTTGADTDNGENVSLNTPDKDSMGHLKARITEHATNSGSTIRNWLVPDDDDFSLISLNNTPVNKPPTEQNKEYEDNTQQMEDNSKVAKWIQQQTFEPSLNSELALHGFEDATRASETCTVALSQKSGASQGLKHEDIVEEDKDSVLHKWCSEREESYPDDVKVRGINASKNCDSYQNSDNSNQPVSSTNQGGDGVNIQPQTFSTICLNDIAESSQAVDNMSLKQAKPVNISPMTPTMHYGHPGLAMTVGGAGLHPYVHGQFTAAQIGFQPQLYTQYMPNNFNQNYGYQGHAGFPNVQSSHSPYSPLQMQTFPPQSLGSHVAYNAVQTGKTKITLRKMPTQKSATNERSDLSHYWNVKKTGDCKLVFCANAKRKAEEETPSKNTNVQDTGYKREDKPQAKRQKCLVY